MAVKPGSYTSSEKVREKSFVMGRKSHNRLLHGIHLNIATQLPAKSLLGFFSKGAKSIYTHNPCILQSDSLICGLNFPLIRVCGAK
jgi:hypothetical protein